MAGSPHPVRAVDKKFKGYLPEGAWTLCLGAGVSRGISPEWQDLAHKVVNESFSAGLSSAEFSSLVKSSGWSLDSWIQAAANEHTNRGRVAEDFTKLIEDEIYSKIRHKAKGLGIESHLTKVLNSPKTEPKEKVIEVCDFIEASFPDCSLLQVAQTLIAAAENGGRPQAILTFNADTLLETYIDLRLRRDHYLGPGPHGHPPYHFVQITRPGPVSGTKIPIIHCHGCIAPTYSTTASPKDSRDRLVFLEQEYLTMAGIHLHAPEDWKA